MNVLSLFDGMSCCRLALEKLDVSVEKYYASEIDKYAIEVTQANYPDTEQLGDVTAWQTWDLDWASIDLVTGGFPCQAWSLAGKQLGDKDERGKLFWTMLDVMAKVMEHNPKAFYLMENVKMKKEFESYITYHTEQALPNVYKYLINSALVSAQSRQRYYWTNIPGVEQPEDRGIVLRDILETEPENFTKMSDKFAERQKGKKCLIDLTKEKASNLSAMEYVKNGRQGDYLACDYSGKPKQVGGAFRGRAYDKDGKRMDKDGVSVANKTTQMLELRKDDKSNAITTVYKDSVVVSTKPNQINPSKKASGKQPYMQERVFHKEGKSHALTREFASRTHIGETNELTWRKLTALECERLQTVPDNYTAGVSNTQRYKMLGNGWTVDVIAHIFTFMQRAHNGEHLVTKGQINLDL